MVKFNGKLRDHRIDPKWPNTKAIKVGWLAGRGNTSPVIAQILADGTTEETIRTQLQRADLKRIGENKSVLYVPIKLTSYERTQLTKRAQARGMELGEWIRRVAISAGIPDDLFEAIVPGED